MRARNREINIFNMSLLDILTGMLGAFLFLMLGLLPYYATVSKNKDINPVEFRKLKEENQELRNQTALQQQQIADLNKQLEELQKIVKQSGGGPLTAEQIGQLTNQLNQLRQQVAQLRQQLLTEQNNGLQMQGQVAQAQQQVQQVQQQLQQTQQQLDQATKDKKFWQDQQGTISIISIWDSPNTDIDVMVLTPDGQIYSPKPKDKALGKDCQYEGDDSHTGGQAYNQEGLLLFLKVPGDYLVFYRVPPNGHPADYATLHGYILYNEVRSKDNVAIKENGLGDSRSSGAKPGGYYAWVVLTYDPDKMTITGKLATAVKLPNGMLLPEKPAPVPAPTAPVSQLFPFDHRTGTSSQPVASPQTAITPRATATP